MIGFRFFIFVCFNLYTVKSIAIENGVEGEPTISCGANEITFSVNTRKPFGGKIFVKGEYGKVECYSNGVGTPMEGTGTPTSTAMHTGPDISTVTAGGPSTQVPEGSSSTGVPGTSVPTGSSSTTPGPTGSTATRTVGHGTASSLGPGGPTTTTSGQTTPHQTSSPPTTRITGGGIEQCPPCPVCTQAAAQRHFSPFLERSGALLSLPPNTARLIIRVGTCNMKRERRLNPTGVSLTLSVIVSFHQQFITKVDKAYQIRCFYMETEKTVTSIVDVSMPQTTEIVAQASMPICSYTIRRGNPDGPEVQYAKVGDVVFHRWQCDSATPAMFGMLVHNCYVEDGKGQRVDVINKTGCSLDTYVISDLNYETSLYAYVEAHVFKFADQAALDFQCAITICVKEDNGCRGITPPTCGRRKSRRNVEIQYDSDVEYRNNLDVRAERMTIIDLDDDIPSEDLEKFEKMRQGSSSNPRFASKLSRQHNDNESIEKTLEDTFCLSVTAFGLLVSGCTFVLTISATALTTVYFIRHKN